jgi:hypothetical protein
VGTSGLAAVVAAGCAQLLDVGGFTIDGESQDSGAGDVSPTLDPSDGEGGGPLLALEGSILEVSDQMSPQPFCVVPVDCADTPACRIATCESNQCGSTPAPAGSDCDDNGGKRCSAAGECVLCRADERRNDGETDVDCGGSDCPACDDFSACLVNDDCSSGVCKDALCYPATCSDDEKNGDETDVDCGGSCPDPCPQAGVCETPDDCASGYCADGVCCGVPCDGLCERCNATTGACERLALDTDPEDECPGPVNVCNGHGSCSECDDDTKNGNETDFDCGGPLCPRCELGQACIEHRDCQSCFCNAGQCGAPRCNNGQKDECESDVDCGGPCGATCALGRSCARKADCVVRNCVEGQCAL